MNHQTIRTAPDTLSGMRRAARWAFGCLLLAFAVNLGVAWTIAWTHGDVVPDWAPFHNPRAEHPLVVFVTKRFGYELVVGCERPGTLLGRHGDRVQFYDREPWWPREAVPRSFAGQVYGVASGWPLRSFSAWRTTKVSYLDGDVGLLYEPTYHWGLPLHTSRQTGVTSGDFSPHLAILPMRPIWCGVLVNSAFYAVAIWLMVASPCAVRRRIRRRRGFCVACCYPTDAWQVCPECGTAGTHRSQANEIDRAAHTF